METTHSLTCQHCQGSFDHARSTTKYCSKTCKEGARYLRQKASGVAQARATRKLERGYFKTDDYKDRKSTYRKQKRAEGAPWAKDANNRLRARKAGVEYESINHFEIFERDQWVCGECKEPVNRELAFPDPLCATLDHVVPLEDGGPHLKSNVQLAHLRCNSQKSNQAEQQRARKTK